jgi:hypothetical protein
MNCYRTGQHFSERFYWHDCKQLFIEDLQLENLRETLGLAHMFGRVQQLMVV